MMSVTQIMDGHNILDFVDPDIDAKLAELEREEVRGGGWGGGGGSGGGAGREGFSPALLLC